MTQGTPGDVISMSSRSRDVISRSRDVISRPRDIDSGCPCHGCVPAATYSLSSGVPVTQGQVKWSTVVEAKVKGQDGVMYQGCTSDQTSVVCATRR